MPESSNVYETRSRWEIARPHVLVIACADGRLQLSLDEFLAGRGVTRYDRLYCPGGPGALASSGIEFLRCDQFRRETAFLVEAHDIDEIYLIFHGPGKDGPAEAVCADYRRVFPNHNPDQIREEQEKDVGEVLRAGFGWRRQVQAHVWRCEVGAGCAVRFVNLSPEESR